MQQPDMNEIIRAMKAKGYKVFESEPYDLNIVGVRTNDPRADTFNDWIACFYNEGTLWWYTAWPATTDPGLYWRKTLINPAYGGTAILVPGQYRSAYSIGLHRGYTALIQAKPVRIYRDSNKDGVLDTEGMKITEGLYAINIHRASPNKPSPRVWNWSAGCQVFQDPEDFKRFMNLCMLAYKQWGNHFTYTLLEEKDLK